MVDWFGEWDGRRGERVKGRWVRGGWRVGIVVNGMVGFKESCLYGTGTLWRWMKMGSGSLMWKLTWGCLVR